MSRSDSSDSERSRSSRGKHKKKSKHRSHSASSSGSDRNSRKSRKHKSDRRKDDYKRSHSRDRRRSRTRSQERSKNRSRDARQSRSRSRERKWSRSRSRSRSKSQQKQYISGWDETPKPSSKGSSWDSKTKNEPSQEKLSLKEKIKLLTTKDEHNQTILPSAEEIMKIENENFVQENFSSTYIDPSAMPKQKKQKKKNSKKQFVKENYQSSNPDTGKEMRHVSHDDAMFGNTQDTMHVTKFSNKTDVRTKEEVKSLENEDGIFGAMFFDDPQLRMDRWINKLKDMRKKILESQI